MIKRRLFSIYGKSRKLFSHEEVFRTEKVLCGFSIRQACLIDFRRLVREGLFTVALAQVITCLGLEESQITSLPTVHVQRSVTNFKFPQTPLSDSHYCWDYFIDYWGQR